MNNNGIISFEDKLQSYKPQNFTSLEKSVPLIAPFWADIDIEHVTSIDFNETVVYRIIYNDSMILADVSDEIRTYFVSDSLFSADLVLIVTWYKVGFYGASGDDTGKALVRYTTQLVQTYIRATFERYIGAVVGWGLKFLQLTLRLNNTIQFKAGISYYMPQLFSKCSFAAENIC